MATTEYRVSGMSCGHCESAVAEEVGALDGVESVEVSAATGRLVISGASVPDEAAVLAAVDEAGYSAEPVS
ncbi:MAG: heavy-metal-associated domain-containing protein [Actinomycetota bacterium]|nr:heavy-metal-associated domain-containing protein [Actinomycetota bacterium]